MSKPIAVRRAEQAEYTLFEMAQVLGAESAPVRFRDVTINDFELVPGGSFPQQVHDDKLEVVSPIPLGAAQGPVVRYTDDEGSYEIDLGAQDSIIIPRGIRHKAINLSDTHVVLIITNFDYLD